MAFVLAYLGFILLIALEMILYKRFFSRVLLIIKIPALLFVAYTLFWFWGGDGTFNLFIVPSVLVLLELGLLLYLRNIKENARLRLILINVMVFVVPVLTILFTNILAKLFGVDNRVM